MRGSVLWKEGDDKAKGKATHMRKTILCPMKKYPSRCHIGDVKVSKIVSVQLEILPTGVGQAH